MGRTPKSPTEKRLTGASKRRVAATVARRVRGNAGLAAPRWLQGATPTEIWNRISPDLVRLNILVDSDSVALWRYCEYLADWMTATADIKANGHTLLVPMTDSTKMMPRLNPSVRTREIAEKNLKDFEDRFGGSPLARYRLIAQQAAHPGAFGDLFAKGNADPEDAGASPIAAAAAPASPIGMLQRSLN